MVIFWIPFDNSIFANVFWHSYLANSGILFMLKHQAGVEQKEKEKKKKDALQTLKTTIVVSAVIVAVAGVVFAVTKKLREK